MARARPSAAAPPGAVLEPTAAPALEPRGGSAALLLAVVGVAGAGTMTVELSAVRLLAPWFGASSGVWTNVIGVILLALALGYRAGALLSRGARPRLALARALLVAALATAWMPFLAPRVAELFLPAGLALDEAAALLSWGSLAAALVLFLPAAFLLGLVGPLAVEVVQRERAVHAGEAGGRVLAASTLGSIAGTFGTTHLFLPSLGLRWTYAAAALALFACGLAVRAGGRRLVLESAAALALLLAGAALGTARGARAAIDGARLVEARESAYQSLRVLETASESGATLRRLAVNEGLDSFQSVWQQEPGLLPPGYYYNLFALPPWWSDARGEWRVLVLGLGAGTAVRVLDGALPAGATLASTGVEIDPAVVELGERWFDLERGPARRVVAGVDARAFVALADERWDEIVLDCYANNMEIPAHLASVEFFRELAARLAPEGWLAVNAAGFGLADPVVESVAGTLAAALGRRVLGVRVPFARNVVLLARADGELPDPATAEWVRGEGALRALLDALRLPGSWRWYEPAADPLDDDTNPIDRLQRESVRRGRAEWIVEG